MLSHVDEKNNPQMVDVSGKTVTVRIATARAYLTLPETQPFFAVGEDVHSAKGPVFATAIIAGTMAVKKTSELIPFCHPLPIDACKFLIRALTPLRVEIECTVKTRGPTGVEMEALHGASAAALTIYDMCKALTHDMVIGPIELMAKSGGKHDVAKTP